MKINLKSAFNYIFKQDEWYIKIGIAGLISIIAAILALVIGFIVKQFLITSMGLSLDKNALNSIQSLVDTLITLPFNAVIWGYVLHSAHNQIHEIDNILPEWLGNIKKFLINAFSSYFIGLVYSFIFVLIFIPYFIFIMPILSAGLSSIFFIPAIAAAIIMIIFFLLINISASIVYADNFSIRQALDFKYILSVTAKSYSYFILTILAAMSAALVIIFLLTISCIGIIFIPFVSFIIQLITINIYCQVYKQVKQSI